MEDLKEITVDKEENNETRKEIGQSNLVVPKAILNWVAETLTPTMSREAAVDIEPLTSLVGNLGNLVANMEEAVIESPSWYQSIVAMAAGLDSVVDVVEKASTITRMTSKQKLELAVSASCCIYDRIDKGLLGDKDRVKIPWVPARLSDPFERFILRYAIIFGVELLVSRMNRSN